MWCFECAYPLIQAVTLPHPVQRLIRPLRIIFHPQQERLRIPAPQVFVSHVFNYVRLHAYQQTARGRQVQAHQYSGASSYASASLALP